MSWPPVCTAQQVRVGRALPWRRQEPHHLQLGDFGEGPPPPSRSEYALLLNEIGNPGSVHVIVEIRDRTDRMALSLKPHASGTDEPLEYFLQCLLPSQLYEFSFLFSFFESTYYLSIRTEKRTVISVRLYELLPSECICVITAASRNRNSPAPRSPLVIPSPSSYG